MLNGAAKILKITESSVTLKTRLYFHREIVSRNRRYRLINTRTRIRKVQK